MNEQILKTIEALKKNNMNALYIERQEDIVPFLEKEVLFEGATITAGGSVSLNESGVWALLNSGKYNFLDRNREGITAEEKQYVFKTAIGGDFYFCSSNAVTEKGELINVDGFSNRISSIAFGPQKVVMIVGINKIVENATEGLLRVKKIAAPKNCVRLGINNPCAKLGHCVSLLKSDNPDFTDGCSAERRICANYLISGRQQVKDRITVIICGDELGY